MKKQTVIVAVATLIVVGSLFQSSLRSTVAQAGNQNVSASNGQSIVAHVSRDGLATNPISKGMAAIESATADGQYLFLLFRKTDDAQTATMRATLKASLDNTKVPAKSLEIWSDDPDETAVVAKFGLQRAPMPLLLALAPNGAITRGFPLKLESKDFEQAFVSKGAADSLKALQENKLVVLCVGNDQTSSMKESLQAAQNLLADAKYANVSMIVAVDPTDPAEAGFLGNLQVDPKTSKAVTVVLAPPGNPVATFVGPVSKDQIVAKIVAAQKGCCPGGECGPSGCCPTK